MAKQVLDELRELLKIDRYNLDEEIERQPQLYYQVAEAAATAKSQYDAASAELDNLTAALDIKVRKSSDAKGEKVTEALIRRRVQNNQEFREASARALQKKEYAEKLAALRDAFKQRTYMLRDLVELHISGYFTDASVRTSSEKTKDNKAERIRLKMKDKREDRRQSDD